MRICEIGHFSTLRLRMHVAGGPSDPHTNRQDLYTATRGGGAQLNSRRLRVSKRNKIDHSLIGTGFPFRASQNFDQYIKIFSEIMRQADGIRRAGAAALDLAYVAQGSLDGFWETGLKEWDMAAGVLLIKEAGGMISDYQGGENYMSTGEIVGGNPEIFKALLEIVKKHV